MNQIIFWSSIYPRSYTRPIGSYQLAFWLRKHGIDCQVIEFCQWFSSDQLFEFTEWFISNQTKFIGISSTFWPYTNRIHIPQNISRTIDRIKQKYPKIKFVFGGPRVNAVRDVGKYADIILPGEAENSLLTLMKGNNIGVPFNICDQDHRFVEKDCIVEGEVLPIELGRGCIFKCKFCSHANLGKAKHTYQRHIKQIENEIRYNYEHFKTTHYLFTDDTVNEDLDKIRNLSQLPKNTGVDIKWTGYLRADLLWRFPDTPYQLQQSGLASCFFGIESFHKKASLLIGKGWSGNHASTYLPHLYADIWKQNITIANNFIVGLPDETESDLKNTLTWCVDHPMGINRFVPLSLYDTTHTDGPRSEFTTNYKQYGYSIDENGQWKNSSFCQQRAEQVANELNKQLDDINTIASWRLFGLVNCGIPVKEGSLIKQAIETTVGRTQFKSFLSRYKTKLQQLSKY